jgi:hypothetical protein
MNARQAPEGRRPSSSNRCKAVPVRCHNFLDIQILALNKCPSAEVPKGRIYELVKHFALASRDPGRTESTSSNQKQIESRTRVQVR